MYDKASFIVMNNKDLRSIIFSYLSGKYCHQCKKVITNHHYVSFYNWRCCFPCFRKNYKIIMDKNIKYYYKKYKININ